MGGTIPRLLTQLAGELEPAFAAQVDVDERDVRPQFGDLPMRIGNGPGAPDDIEALLHEQSAHLLAEARVVVDDQAPCRDNACTVAGMFGARQWCYPQKTAPGPAPPDYREDQGWRRGGGPHWALAVQTTGVFLGMLRPMSADAAPPATA